MRVNTPESLATARRVYARFGSWQKVREASRLVDGVYLIERTPEEVGVVASGVPDPQ